jgi:uncharacterized YigZ family protein
LREQYKTLRGGGFSEYEEKRSRFLGAAAPAESEEEALGFIASIRAKRKDASHNVYAYLCGEKGLAKRYNDDGEPQWTAGVPVLDVIEKSGLSDAAIVVTRYFGGTLLGAAGLIRSYGKAATMAVADAGMVIKSLAYLYMFLVEYPWFNIVRNELEKGGYTITGVTYGLDIEISVIVPRADAVILCARIGDLTAGSAISERIGETYIDNPC